MKRALVTGSNRGIGKEICRQLAEKDFFVIMCGRDLKKVKAAQEEIDPGGEKTFCLQLDVTNKEHILIAAERIEQLYGALDVLVNNAGQLGSTGGFTDLQEDEFEKIFNANSLGPMRMMRAFAPLLSKHKNGRIINMSTGMSVLGNLGGNYVAYRLSKVFLNAMTIMAANEFSSKGIKVFAMDPGWVKTEMGGASAMLNVREGADTASWLATDSSAVSGKFYRGRKQISFS